MALNAGWTTYKDIMERVRRKYKFSELYDDDVKEWIWEVIGYAGTIEMLEPVSANVTIEDWKGTLPVDIYDTTDMMVVDVVANKTLTETADAFFMDHVDDNSETISRIMGQNVVYVDTTIDPNYPTYVQNDENSTNPEVTAFIQTTSREPLYPKIPGYKINGNTIWANTNQNTTLRLSYHRFPIWDDFTPKIPDDPKVIRMCADYVALQHAIGLRVMGEIPRDVFEWIETQYYHSAGAARNAARIPSLGKMEELKNKYLDILKKPTDFSTRFMYLGQPTQYKI